MAPLFCLMFSFLLHFHPLPPPLLAFFFSLLLCVFTCSPLFSHQSLQGMLSSLHSELDIQRYLMKIQLPHRVSQPFFLIVSASCHYISVYVWYFCTLTNICCMTMPLLDPVLSVPAKHTCPPSLTSSTVPVKAPTNVNCTEHKMLKYFICPYV